METWPRQSWCSCPDRKIMKNQLHAQLTTANPENRPSVSKTPMSSTSGVSITPYDCVTQCHPSSTLFLPCITLTHRCTGDFPVARGTARLAESDGGIGRVPGVRHQSEPTGQEDRMVSQCKLRVEPWRGIGNQFKGIIYNECFQHFACLRALIPLSRSRTGWKIQLDDACLPCSKHWVEYSAFFIT